MAFRSNRQRKAFFASKGNIRSNVKPESVEKFKFGVTTKSVGRKSKVTFFKTFAEADRFFNRSKLNPLITSANIKKIVK